MTSDLEHNLYERLLTFYSQGEFKDEVELARREYEERVGSLRTEEPKEDYFLSCFHSWYLFTRPLSGYLRPPILISLEVNALQVNEEERRLLETWSQCIHSLFLLKGVKENHLVLQDLFHKKKINVTYPRADKFFTKNDLIEARVYPALSSPKEFDFLPGICAHPFAAKKFVDLQLKRAQSASKSEVGQFFHLLQKCKLKVHRYPNVDLGAFYNEQPLF